MVVFEHGLGASEHYGTGPDMVFDFFASFDMKISNLSSFLRKNKPLSKEEFEDQYHNKINYYFIAHP